MEGLFSLSPRTLEEKEMGSQPFSLIKYTQSVRVGVGEEGGTCARRPLHVRSPKHAAPSDARRSLDYYYEAAPEKSA